MVTTLERPHATVILAMTADGKIADVERHPARFGSAADKLHLEKQVAASDGVLFGAGTLRAYGTTMRVISPQLLQQRQQAGKPPQPVQILVSQSGNINPELRFFQQPVPRWLLTTPTGAKAWGNNSGFERIIVTDSQSLEINWIEAFKQLNFQRLAILGGGELVASLLAADLVDELRLTICPLCLGGTTAPTPVGGTGLFPMKPLELISVEAIAQEVFLHYRVIREAREAREDVLLSQ